MRTYQLELRCDANGSAIKGENVCCLEVTLCLCGLLCPHEFGVCRDNHTDEDYLWPGFEDGVS